MKKILLVSNKVMHYRVSVYNYFYKRFLDEGYEFTVGTNNIQGINQNEVLFDYRELEFSFFKYAKEINKIKPDAVIIFLHLKEKLYWSLVHWLKFKGIPVIYWNKAINYDAAGSRFRKSLFNHMHTVSNAIILYSETEKAHIQEKNHHKLFFANNTVNFDDYPEIKETKKAIKKELGIPFEHVVLFTGRMKTSGGRKKVDHLIHIFNKLERDDVGLVIVGSGFSDEFAGMITKENVIYLGEIHDPENRQISKIFKMADIFCIPGHIGLGINQAMYWGLPVVTEDGGQPPEINYLIDGKTGFLVGNNDVESLKEKLLYLIDNEPIRRDFGERARKRILDVASIDNMFQAFKDSCLFAIDSQT